MSEEQNQNLSDYFCLFEVGTVNSNPAVKCYGNEIHTLTPVQLAGLVTVLFETVMLYVDESNQNHYEKTFLKAFKKLMKERHNFEIKRTFVEPNDEE